MTAIFRVLPFIYICLGLLFIIPVATTIYNVAIVIPRIDPDMLEPVSLVPTITLLFIGLVLITISEINGILLLKRKHRRTSIILSCILLLAFPIGTLLGIATLFVLNQGLIKARYAEQDAAANP